MKAEPEFKSEADLCRAFIAALPEGWTAYPETCGFDIVLVRSDGCQIGIEAKLRLNAEVISQIVDYGYDPCSEGPDFRAILVPSGRAGSFTAICKMLGITVIIMEGEGTLAARQRWNIGRETPYRPVLPLPKERYWSPTYQDWIEWAPAKRLQLPDYVPDVIAGASAPVSLTEWKIRAIKIAILVERRGFVTREDFKAVGIDYRRWIDPYVKWLARSDTPGKWIAGEQIGVFKTQHPVNYEQIAADFDKWAPKPSQAPAYQEPLL